MIATIVPKPLVSFLLVIGFLLCVGEGYIVRFRPTAGVVTTNTPRTMPLETTSGATPMATKRLDSSLSVLGEKSLVVTTTVDSEDIVEMAAFVCFRLLQVVAAEFANQDEHGEETKMDPLALEKLARALQPSERHSKSPSNAAAAADSPQPTAAAATATTTATTRATATVVKER